MLGGEGVMGKAKAITKLTDVRPQVRNANRHTQRGIGLLEDSIQRDGWIGAITVAADGEAFDGSARIEVGAGAGFEDAIVVESDGSRPIIHRRIDIPTADDPKAVKLGVAANRIAQIDLDMDAEILAGIVADGVDLSDLYSGDEFSALANEVPDVEFREYDESVENEVQYCECPSCGHKFPK